MISPDRLDELETFRMEDDTPEDARISLPWRDLRDLVSLIPFARATVAPSGARPDTTELCKRLEALLRKSLGPADAFVAANVVADIGRATYMAMSRLDRQ